MGRFALQMRLIPVVALAAGVLLLLKIMALSSVFITGTLPGGEKRTLAAPKQDPHQFFGWGLTKVRQNPPIENPVNEKIVTGSAAKKKEKPANAPQERPQENISQSVLVSPSERALLEALQSRRAELDQRQRELEEKQALLESTEKRLKDQLQDIKTKEEKNKNSEVDPSGKPVAGGGLKPLVIMYEAMRAKDAARVFDRLEMPVLLDLARLMNPKKLGDVVAQMQPENAERLTRELARRDTTQAPQADSLDSLPKIEGRPAAANPR